MFDVIERLKAEWTDKYVVVASPAPELARFAAATGIVKTVNMNGRCLVQFDQYNNTGWYDIDPACLKVVPKPLPKPAESKPAKPAASAKPAAPKEAAKPAASGKPSTADILAAARGKGASPATPTGKPSTADILAAARGKKAPEASAAPVTPPPAEAEVPSPPAPVAAPANPAAAGPLPTTTVEIIAWCRTHDAKS
jgi:pyruvate/2-oxoglutarate dehydrogenase complex dihydrolipoamide acyltransferase (E2) component